MKLLLSLALCSACFMPTAYAGSDESYDVATQELDRIQGLTQDLADGIRGWDGSDLQTALDNIHTPAEETTNYIMNATEKLQKLATTFSITQSFKIASPTQRLAYAVNASVATLADRRDEFESTGITSIVVTDLESLLSASQGFARTLISYVPDVLQPVALNLQNQIIDSLNQGINCFNGTTSACITDTIDTTRTYDLAVRYDAMKADGSPITAP